MIILTSFRRTRPHGSIISVRWGAESESEDEIPASEPRRRYQGVFLYVLGYHLPPHEEQHAHCPSLTRLSLKRVTFSDQGKPAKFGLAIYLAWHSGCYLVWDGMAEVKEYSGQLEDEAFDSEENIAGVAADKLQVHSMDNSAIVSYLPLPL